MEETEGFEPSRVLPLHAFQACALDHYAISPFYNLIIGIFKLNVKAAPNLVHFLGNFTLPLSKI